MVVSLPPGGNERTSLTRRIDAVGDGRCRVSADIWGRPGGVMRFLTVIGKRVARKSIEVDYDRLVAHFEEE